MLSAAPTLLRTLEHRARGEEQLQRCRPAGGRLKHGYMRVLHEGGGTDGLSEIRITLSDLSCNLA